jgi:glycosyltransferase involved in cell wall biosynthesis
MKIAIDARIINTSTGRYVERLVTYLQDIDKENHYYILVRAKDRDFWQPKQSNFEVRVAEFDNYSLGEQTKFLKYLNELNVDLVHFCMPQQPLLYLKPHVTTVHDLTLLKTYNSDKNWVTYHIKQLVGFVVFFMIARTSKHILVPTKFTKNEYIKFARIPEDKVTVTYEAADAATFTPKEYKLPFKKFLMYVGSQSDYKNIKGIIQAYQQLKVKYPDLGLVLVGNLNEPAKRNQEWVRQHGFDDVVFTGFVSNEELTWLYQHCATYVFASFMEGFGLPALEAMACGAPVASSNATCLPEVYGDAAHYFDPHSTHDIARAIEEVITDDKLRDDLVKKGLVQAKKYSWLRMAQQTHEVYMRHFPSANHNFDI